MAYYGKYSLSKKAVDIELVKIEPLGYQPGTTQATMDHISGSFPSTSTNINGAPGQSSLELALAN